MNEPSSVRRLRRAPSVDRLARRARRLLAQGLLQPPRGQLVIAQAITPEELCAAYRLVHDVFVGQGYIAPTPRGMRVRVFELLPETCTFVARLGGEIVGVMSVVPDSRDLGLPSDSAFHRELSLLRHPERRLIEISNLAVAREYRSTTVFLELARCITAHVMNEDCDDAFVAVSPQHALFFEGILRFEPWGKRRASGADVVQGCRADVGGFEPELRRVDAALGDQGFLHSWFFDQNPFFEITRRSVPIARRRFLREDTRALLLGEPSEWGRRLSPSELRALDRRWQRAS